MRIYWRELVVLCHYLDKSFDKKHGDGGDMMHLIYYVTSRENIFKGLCKFMGESPSQEEI